MGGAVSGAFDFGFGRDLTVHGSSPASGLLLSVLSPLWILCLPLSLSLFLSAPPLLALFLSKIKKKKIKCGDN